MLFLQGSLIFKLKTSICTSRVVKIKEEKQAPTKKRFSSMFFHFPLKVARGLSSLARGSTPKVLCSEVVGKTPWLQLETLSYSDAVGKTRKWDMCARTTTNASGIDAVAIIAMLVAPGKPSSIVLVKQFRPPVDAFTIELPAGLIDAGESASEAAVRELWEETGLTAEASACKESIPLVLSPGLSNESIRLVTVTVDASLAENQPGAEQHLDDSEDITIIRCDLDQLLPTLNRYDAAGDVCFAGLYTLAAGFQMAAAAAEARP
jgi:8-oxo-dGTP pyrophosphatase MutT (NUDIX family)